MTRRRIIASVVVVLAAWLWWYRVWSLDGPSCLLYLLVPSATEYSDGYSDARFRRVRIGMSEQQVSELLGDPFETDHGYWTYSKSPDDGNYFRRWIIFEDGLVERRVAKFYLD